MRNLTEETSYLAFTSGGSASRRWNMIGTRCRCVTLCSWMARSVASESHLSSRTKVAPAPIEKLMSKASGAA